MGFTQLQPLDFRLLNDKNEDEFYLEDKQGFINLEITNKSGTPLEIGKSQDNILYHFGLKFRPGTLVKFAVQNIGGWVIKYAQTDEDGCVLLTISSENEVVNFKKDEVLNIKFAINIDGRLGTRSTNVLLLYNPTNSDSLKTRQINWTIINHRGKPFIPLELTFNDAATILNNGTENELSFRISNTSKNSTGINTNVVFNSQEEAGPLSKICIFFEIGPEIDENVPGRTKTEELETGVGADHVLGSGSVVKDIEINIGRADLFTPENHSTEPLPVWIFKPSRNFKNITLLPHVKSSRPKPETGNADNTNRGAMVAASMTTPQAPPTSGIELTEASEIQKSGSQDNGSTQPHDPPKISKEIITIDFKISKIKTKYITGRTKMYVRFENIPGYWDETFVLNIDKQPFVMKGQKIGIGTNQPAAQLHIQAESKGLNIPLLLRNKIEDNNSSVGIGFLNDRKVINGDKDQNADWIKAAIVHEKTGERGIGSMHFLLNNIPDEKPTVLDDARLSITKDGNVGIGTVNPNCKLQIQVDNPGLNLPLLLRNKNGKEHENSIGIGFLNESKGDWAKAAIVHERTGPFGIGSMHFLLNNTIDPQATNLNEAKLTITSNGNVGIGIQNPQAPLQFKKEGGQKISLYNADQNQTTCYGFGIGESKLQIHSDSIGTNIVFGYGKSDALTETMRIQGNGFVGIGTTTPSAKLQIQVDNFGIGLPLLLKNKHVKDSNKNSVGIGFSNDPNGDWIKAAIVHETLGDWGTGSMHFVLGNTPDANNAGFGETRLSITKEGNVGIGTMCPQFPLDISRWLPGRMQGNDEVPDKGYWFMFQNINDVRRSNSTNSNSVSIRATGIVWAFGFATSSDFRIKEHLLSSNATSDLEKIRNLHIVDYRYKDFVHHANNYRKGLIAQEVEAIYPQAVSKHRDFIPDIYAIPNSQTLTGDELLITMSNQHTLVEGDMVRFITSDNTCVEKQITTITDDKSFSIKGWTDPTDHLFVYGKQVEDFRVIDYEQIFSAGISAIQELSKQLETQKNLLVSMEARLQKLENTISK